jgi:hypothetical protein
VKNDFLQAWDLDRSNIPDVDVRGIDEFSDQFASIHWQVWILQDFQIETASLHAKQVARETLASVGSAVSHLDAVQCAVS